MTTTATQTLLIDGRPVPLADDRNLLETIRRAGVDLPTFCYHSELSVYGACRLCVVEVDGRGVQASCSLMPEAGMVVRTATPALRKLRRTTLELLLANHEGHCTTCDKAARCRLEDLARRLGIDRVRFQHTAAPQAADRSSPAVHREPGKCILCGDCVRMCSEIQGVGALDFAHRGAQTVVQPAFGRGLGETDCVHCGQCSRVCPTGALVPANDVEAAWTAFGDPARTVVVQIAPAVRVALAEVLDLPAGADALGILCAALRRLGADAVYDTSFTADLTVVEEANEFAHRVKTGGVLPMFTSCCPSWVAYAEKFTPDLLPHLSSCRSPQQMFGSLARKLLPGQLGCGPQDLTVISLMPCTAKKFEATRPEFTTDGRRDVDLVLTTQEIGRLIAGSGLDLNRLAPEPPDLPFGMKTGAGVLFGNSGGVTEAVLRYAAAVLGDGRLRHHEFTEVRGPDGTRIASVDIGGMVLRVAAVSGLANARRLIEDVKAGRQQADLIEVMACPGGCIGGAGQPVDHVGHARSCRTAGIVAADRAEVLRNSADNPAVTALYHDHLESPGSHTAHELLHTSYQPRRRLGDLDLLLTTGEASSARLLVMACLGTSCHLRGGQAMVHELVAAVEAAHWQPRVDVRATFCLERCGEGPNVKVGDRLITGATVATVMAAIRAGLEPPCA